MTEAKTKELTDENTKISLEEEALHFKVESLVSIKAYLEAKLKFTEEGRRHVEHMAFEAQLLKMMAKNARRRVEEKLNVYEQMAFTKHKQLAEVMAELAKFKEQLASLEAPTCADPKEGGGVV
ncbi:hypothetical protein Adt_45525 [Abeliophyllum distichum]|uniref:Uncharacterized protein n=1 Tax=Abeliophyllum distichum TaxID=126358 RepID=A0ABD1PDZ7_9LAMI